MKPKVEIMVSVHINGRPIWRKSKDVGPENTLRMADKEYDRVVAAAALELERRVVVAKKSEAKED